MLVIAHRGASGHQPENTLGAYELAIEMRSDMLELDLHQTRDDEIVVMHDAKLEGLGGSGEVGDATLAQVRALDAGGGARVPTLAEVLDGFAARIPLNLEIKWGAGGDYPGLEGRVLAALAERGLGADILFSSFRPSILARLRTSDSESRLALLISPRSGLSVADAIAHATQLGAEALNPYFAQVDAALVAAAHAATLAVNTYTVDAEDWMRRFVELGVDGIFTNYPDRLRELLDREPAA